MEFQLDSLEMDRLIATGSVGGGGAEEAQALEICMRQRRVVRNIWLAK